MRQEPAIPGVSDPSPSGHGNTSSHQHINQRPPGSDPIRPPRATQSATRLLPGDADLAEVTAAWPDLPGPIRAGILAMVRAAAPGEGSGES